MKVLVVGYTKTGTKTVDSALQSLGYRVSGFPRSCYDLAVDWRKFFNGNGSPDDLRRMYEGYDAASDMPTFRFWREFVKAFPDIKLILMERETQGFLRSWKSHTDKSDEDFSFPYYFSATARQYIDFLHEAMQAMIPHPPPTWSFFKKCPQYDDEVLLKAYLDHNNDVIKNAPPSQLLRFDLKDGWGPLCRFLEIETPRIPFPHANKGGAVNEIYMGNTRKEMLISASLIFATVGVALGFILYCL